MLSIIPQVEIILFMTIKKTANFDPPLGGILTLPITKLS